MKKYDTNELIDLIDNDGESAYSLLYDADKNFEKRFKDIDKSLSVLLKDIKKHFPDACYYTASGGFNLTLGNTHNNNSSCQQLVALCGKTEIQDGDF